MAGDLPENGHCQRAREWSSLRADGELSGRVGRLVNRDLAKSLRQIAEALDEGFGYRENVGDFVNIGYAAIASALIEGEPH